MPRVIDNVVIKGLSGIFGKQIVFKNWGGVTFFSKAPVRNRNVVVSEAQAGTRIRFKQAAAYAKKVMHQPELKIAYKEACKIRQNAFSRAVQDFFTAPVIHETDVSGYSGRVGDLIRIFVTDDFCVKKVRVSISGENNEIIESGFAAQKIDSDWWFYKITTENQHPERVKITVSAYDIPGNETRREVGVPT